MGMQGGEPLKRGQGGGLASCVALLPRPLPMPPSPGRARLWLPGC